MSTKRWKSRRATAVIGCIALCAGVAGTALTAGGAFAANRRSATTSAESLSRAVTVTRDSAGVAHIVAKNFTALGYGEGYAFAQDNLCTFANDMVTVEGERSKYFGAEGLSVNYAAGVSCTNLDSDLYWRYVQATGTRPARAHDGPAERSSAPGPRDLHRLGRRLQPLPRVGETA